MDCITISTFRSLEQQAIRQYNETKSREVRQHYYIETFGKESTSFLKTCKIKNEPTIEQPTEKNKINYYA